MSGGNPYLIGEEGPEIFVPKTAGRVLSVEQSQGALRNAGGQAPVTVQAPPVNVSVVNVTDPADVTDAMGSTEGERTIVNVIRRRRREINNALG